MFSKTCLWSPLTTCIPEILVETNSTKLILHSFLALSLKSEFKFSVGPKSIHLFVRLLFCLFFCSLVHLFLVYEKPWKLRETCNLHGIYVE